MKIEIKKEIDVKELVQSLEETMAAADKLGIRKASVDFQIIDKLISALSYFENQMQEEKTEPERPKCFGNFDLDPTPETIAEVRKCTYCEQLERCFFQKVKEKKAHLICFGDYRVNRNTCEYLACPYRLKCFIRWKSTQGIKDE